MFTNKDITYRSVFLLNCTDKKNLRVSNGELLMEKEEEDKRITLTKIPFQKVLALFIIGNITLTSPLLEKCRKYNVAVVVMKRSLRPVFFLSSTADGNFLLRQRQHLFSKNDISIAKTIVANKITNQCTLLQKTRKKDELTLQAITLCKEQLSNIFSINNYQELLGFEGRCAKAFFKAYFQNLEWNGRKPRTKQDEINVVLDIGYSILFNFVEVFVRMFGFDIYVGVYHRLWFQRKSLICDIMEPFRAIIDHKVLLCFNRKQFKKDDFIQRKTEYYLKREKASEYYSILVAELVPYKNEIFRYVRDYYRCFMASKSPTLYPQFLM